jgi:hypothetical protein
MMVEAQVVRVADEVAHTEQVPDQVTRRRRQAVDPTNTGRRRRGRDR